MIGGEIKPRYSIDDAVKARNGGVVIIKKIEKTEKGIVYNDHYPEENLIMGPEMMTSLPKKLFAYEKISTGKIEKYTREFAGNQYLRRAPEWDEGTL